jgi:hypothetical protein
MKQLTLSQSTSLFTTLIDALTTAIESIAAASQLTCSQSAHSTRQKVLLRKRNKTSQHRKLPPGG